MVWQKTSKSGQRCMIDYLLRAKTMGSRVGRRQTKVKATNKWYGKTDHIAEDVINFEEGWNSGT